MLGVEEAAGEKFKSFSGRGEHFLTADSVGSHVACEPQLSCLEGEEFVPRPEFPCLIEVLVVASILFID